MYFVFFIRVGKYLCRVAPAHRNQRSFLYFALTVGFFTAESHLSKRQEHTLQRQADRASPLTASTETKRAKDVMSAQSSPLLRYLRGFALAALSLPPRVAHLMHTTPISPHPVKSPHKMRLVIVMLKGDCILRVASFTSILVI